MAKSNSSKYAEAASPGRYIPVEERKSGPFDDYDVRSALECLTRAKKIERNRPLMKAVRAEAKKQLAAAQGTIKTLSHRS